MMFKNYLKIAIRNFLKNKFFTSLNITGLALGLAVVIITAVFVMHELSYDHFHQNKDNIYRLVKGNPADKDSFAGIPAPLGPYLKENFAEIVNFTRLKNEKMLVHYQNKIFNETGIFLVDPAFLEIFSFPLVQGNPQTALQNPNSIVITKEMAEKYFGDENPVGKTLSVDEKYDYVVSAVAENTPQNSHLHFNCLIRFDSRERTRSYMESWSASNFFTYVLLKENIDPDLLKAKTLTWIEQNYPGQLRRFQAVHYQPVTQIHFQYNRKNIEPAFDKKYIYIFISVAFLVLIIACINFMNLSTSLSLKRAKEVGLRRVIGAHRNLLIKQFLGEALLYTFMAMAVSLLLVEVLLPVINNIAGKTLAIDYTNYWFISGLLCLVLLTGLLSGSYPAFVLSSFMPAKVLKNNKKQQGTAVRNFLVVFQFVISIALIIATIVINQQLTFIRTKDLGIEKEYILNIPLQSKELAEKSGLIKNELLKHPNILSVSGNRYQASYFNDNWGGIRGKGMSKDDAISLWIIGADKDFIKTFDIKMIEGHDFADLEASDKWSFILNKSALKALGYDKGVGQEIIYWGNKTARIVGVTEDFNFRSLHHEVAPCAIVLAGLSTQLSLRLRAGDIQETINDIQTVWGKMAQNIPFSYYFLDEDIDKLYKSEITISKILTYFSALSIIVACLGLFGLAAFMAQQRTKEVGIRKVLGASTSNIIVILTKDSTKWIIIANLVAWPIAWSVMNRWLQSFAYRIELSLLPFLISGCAALLIALITVSWQAIRAALANPVEAIRNE